MRGNQIRIKIPSVSKDEVVQFIAIYTENTQKLAFEVTYSFEEV